MSPLSICSMLILLRFIFQKTTKFSSNNKSLATMLDQITSIFFIYYCKTKGMVPTFLCVNFKLRPIFPGKVVNYLLLKNNATGLGKDGPVQLMGWTRVHLHYPCQMAYKLHVTQDLILLDTEGMTFMYTINTQTPPCSTKNNKTNL